VTCRHSSVSHIRHRIETFCFQHGIQGRARSRTIGQSRVLCYKSCQNRRCIPGSFFRSCHLSTSHNRPTGQGRRTVRIFARSAAAQLSTLTPRIMIPYYVPCAIPTCWTLSWGEDVWCSTCHRSMCRVHYDSRQHRCRYTDLVSTYCPAPAWSAVTDDRTFSGTR
jgi:hypothetical protein